MTLLAHAERIKLGRVLGVPPDDLEYLGMLSVSELRALRERISAALFDRHAALFKRAAGPARILPAGLNARLSEKVFGPFLSARMSSVMPPDRAAEVARHLSPKFLAEISLSMDPRRSRAVLEGMPADIVVAAARELMKRGEHVVMGQFVDGLPDATIKAVADQALDDAALVQVGFYVERSERLSELIGLLPESRIDGILKTVAAGPPELQTAGLVIMSQLVPQQQGRFGERIVALGPEIAEPLVAAAKRDEALEVVATVMENVSEATKKKAIDSGLLQKVRQAVR